MHDCLLFLLPRCIRPHLPPAKDEKATSWAQHAELVSVVECNNCCEVEYPASLLMNSNILEFCDKCQMTFAVDLFGENHFMIWSKVWGDSILCCVLR